MVCLPWYARDLHGATAGKYSSYSSFFNTVVSSHNEITMCGHILNESIPGRWIGHGVLSPEPRPPPVTQPWISSCGGIWRVIFAEHPWLTLQPSRKNISAIWSAEKGMSTRMWAQLDYWGLMWSGALAIPTWTWNKPHKNFLSSTTVCQSLQISVLVNT